MGLKQSLYPHFTLTVPPLHHRRAITSPSLALQEKQQRTKGKQRKQKTFKITLQIKQEVAIGDNS